MRWRSHSQERWRLLEKSVLASSATRIASGEEERAHDEQRSAYLWRGHHGLRCCMPAPTRFTTTTFLSRLFLFAAAIGPMPFGISTP